MMRDPRLPFWCCLKFLYTWESMHIFKAHVIKDKLNILNAISNIQHEKHDAKPDKRCYLPNLSGPC
jgi:hypothetical protein